MSKMHVYMGTYLRRFIWSNQQGFLKKALYGLKLGSDQLPISFLFSISSSPHQSLKLPANQQKDNVPSIIFIQSSPGVSQEHDWTI
jgi:hypothetical protein